ncbi:MAG: pentose kinase [Clostridia bacterium]|nr:pentose kinase [Clostridia bacterium]
MKDKLCVLSLDLGTGGVKASLVSEDCNIICNGFASYKTFCDADGRREQRPDDWWGAVVTAVRQMVSEADAADVSAIAAIAISGHSMGRVPVNANGELLEEYTPIWSDSRARAEADEFFGKVSWEEWYRTTGNGSPPPHYAVFKIMRLKKQHRDIYDRAAAFIGTKDYVNMRLCGAICSDRSYATGSGVYDLVNDVWQDSYIAASGIDASKLPKLYNSTDIIGHVTREAAQTLGIPAGVLVAAGGVDNGCMALGAGCVREGEAYCSLGSSSWIAAVSQTVDADVKSKPYIFGHCIPGFKLTHEGIFSSGTSHDWVINNMFCGFAAEERYARFDELAASAPVGANGLLFCPALAGGSSADPSPDMRGSFMRMDLSHTRADIARATLEGLALQLRYVSECMMKNIKCLTLTGGGARSSLLRQIYADVFDVPVAVTEVTRHTAALGAAALALVGIGAYENFDFIGTALGNKKLTYPDHKNAKRYAETQKNFACVMQMAGELGKA